MRKLLGYQLANAGGVNIQGDDEDPTGFASFEIMSPETANAVMQDNPGYLLMPIFDDCIEEYRIV